MVEEEEEMDEVVDEEEEEGQLIRLSVCGRHGWHWMLFDCNSLVFCLIRFSRRNSDRAFTSRDDSCDAASCALDSLLHKTA